MWKESGLYRVGKNVRCGLDTKGVVWYNPYTAHREEVVILCHNNPK